MAWAEQHQTLTTWGVAILMAVIVVLTIHFVASYVSSAIAPMMHPTNYQAPTWL